MLRDERLELSDELVVASQCQVGVDAELGRREPDLVEPRDRRLGEAFVGEVRERRYAPQRQSLAQPL